MRNSKVATLIAAVRTFSLTNAAGVPTGSLDCLEETLGHPMLRKPYTIAETCSQHAVTMLG